MIDDVEYTCLEAGMNKVITKPIRYEIFQSLITEYQISNNLLIHENKQSTALILANDFDGYPLLDIEAGISTLGSEETLIDLLQMLLTENSTDIKQLNDAWNEQNFATVQCLVHKIKSGALYCGTTRMQSVCEALENHFKDQKEEIPFNLYQFFCKINEHTLTAIKTWLRKKQL